MYLLNLKWPEVPIRPRSSTEHGWVRRSVCPFVLLVIKTHFIIRLLLIPLLRFLSSFPLYARIWRGCTQEQRGSSCVTATALIHVLFIFIFSYNGFQSKCPQAAQAYDKIVFPTTVVKKCMQTLRVD